MLTLFLDQTASLLSANVTRLDAGSHGEDLVAFEPFHECACPLLRCEPDGTIPSLACGPRPHSHADPLPRPDRIFALGRNEAGQVRTSVPHENVTRLDAGSHGEDLVAFEPFHECASLGQSRLTARSQRQHKTLLDGKPRTRSARPRHHPPSRTRM
jgi:hypothetical protein